MRITKLLYVFSLFLVFFLSQQQAGFAQIKGIILLGSATWYGDQYHGQKTSSGEVFNKNELTAAHPTLPFGTKVKVTNTVTKQSVIVRINDRGPFGKKGYIIDLSEAAARKIKLHQYGYGKVSLEVLPANYTASTILEEDIQLIAPLTPYTTDSLPLSNCQYYVVQAGSFSDITNAQIRSEKLKAIDQFLPITLNEDLVNGKKIHRVVAGQFTSRQEAEKFRSELMKKGIPVLVKQINTPS